MHRLLGAPRYTSARTLIGKTRQSNVDMLIRKRCYSLKHRNEGSQNKDIKSVFDFYSLKMSNLFDKWSCNI